MSKVSKTNKKTTSRLLPFLLTWWGVGGLGRNRQGTLPNKDLSGLLWLSCSCKPGREGERPGWHLSLRREILENTFLPHEFFFLLSVDFYCLPFTYEKIRLQPLLVMI